MRIQTAYKLIKEIVTNPTPIPVFIKGPPGVGKSAIVKQLAKELNMRLLDLRVSLHPDPVDWGGLCSIENGRTVFYPPAFMPSPDDPPTIIFLDEINTAPPATQALCYQMLLEHRVREFDIGKQHRFIAAGNRVQDKAITHSMASALVSRMAHIEIEADIESFTSYAISNNIRDNIIAFLNFRPNLLTGEMSNNDPFPTPRTWEMASRLPEDQNLIAACVGEGAAAEYMGYLKVYSKLPLVSDILKDPLKTKLPDMSDPSAPYALIYALVSGVIKAKGVGINSASTYIQRLDSEEWFMLFLRALVNADNSKRLGNSKEYAEIITKPEVLKVLKKTVSDLGD